LLQELAASQRMAEPKQTNWFDGIARRLLSESRSIVDFLGAGHPQLFSAGDDAGRVGNSH
jgi:hypothetical protein